MSGLNQEFAQFVRSRRGTETQLQFAARAGISHSYLSHMEQGQVPPARTVKAMALALGEDPNPWLQAAGYPQGGFALGQSVAVPEIQRGVPRVGLIREHGLVELDRLDGKEAGEGFDMPERFALVVQTASPGGTFQVGDTLIFHQTDCAPKNSRVIVREADGICRLVRYIRAASSDGNLSVQLLDVPGMQRPVTIEGQIIALYVAMTTADY